MLQTSRKHLTQSDTMKCSASTPEWNCLIMCITHCTKNDDKNSQSLNITAIGPALFVIAGSDLQPYPTHMH